MKKLLFIPIIFAVLFALSGCAENQTFTAKEYSYDCDSVIIDVIDREIQISPSDDGKVYISCHESEKEYYDVRVDDGVLTLRYAENKEWNDFIGVKPSEEYRKIVIKAPALSKLSATTTNAKITVNGLTADGMNLSNNNGDILLNKISVGKNINLTAKNGDLAGTVIGSWDDFSINCTVKKGDCNLPLNKADGEKSLTADCNNGNINISFTDK